MANKGCNGLLLLVALGLFLAVPCQGQSIEIYPSELSRVPVADLGARFYWQQLRLELGYGDAASDSAIGVTMPPGIVVADTDQDGRVEDEIRVVYDPAGSENPGFIAAQVSQPDRLVVSSVRPAAAGGQLYLQFPIGTTALLGHGSVRYGRVAFADPMENDLEEGPVLDLVVLEEYQVLGSMDMLQFSPVLAQGTDTTTAALGTTFPDQAELLVLSPPDLIHDRGQGTLSNLLRADMPQIGDGQDDNDTEYRFFWATEPELRAVGEDIGIEARVAAGEGAVAYGEEERGEQAVRLLTRDLPAGTYYLYAVSSLTGRLPLARSRALEIRHEPVILEVGSWKSDITLDSGELLNLRGEATGEGQEEVVIEFAALDHDDLVAVRLFYSEEGALESSAVQGGPGEVALAGAWPIAGAEALPESGGSFTWNVVSPELIVAGDYYVYAATSDGRTPALRRSARQVRVRHSPSLRLDALDDRVVSGADTITTGGLRPQRFVTFTWNRGGEDGDRDLDDDARIALYYSLLPAGTEEGEGGWSLPGGVEDFLEGLGTAVWPIGRDISEDPDGRLEDQFVWDLWGLAETGQPIPRAGQLLYVYGIIEDSRSRRLVQMNGGRRNDAGSRLVFRHLPALRVLQPASDVVLKPGRRVRISWEDMDLDSDARIRVLLSRQDLGGVTHYQALAEGGAVVVNATGGKAAPRIDPEQDLSEDSPVDYLDLRVEESGVEDGGYYLYLAITDLAQFDEKAIAWRGWGRIEVQRAAETQSDTGMVQLLPQVFSLGTQGMGQTFELRVDDRGKPVDLLQVRLEVDGGFFAVADQDSLREGVQPFAVGPDFSPALLVTNQVEGGDGGPVQLFLEYYQPTAGRIAGLDGSRPLATFGLSSRQAEGPAVVALASDPQGTGGTRFEYDGQLVEALPGGPLAEGVLVAGRAAVEGQVGLEGRADMNTLIDVSLRPWAQYAPLQDSLFAAANDADPQREGVQVELGEDGGFALTEVPVGRLDLYVHLDGYLDGWVPGLDLYPAQRVEGVVPASPGGEGMLLAGDVAGYLDAAGGILPDNEVTLVDWDYVAAFFGAEVGLEEGSGRADITGDGVVNIKDLSLVGANYLKRGPRPVYKPLPVEKGWVELTLDRTPEGVEPGREVELAVRGQGLDRVRAFELALRYAPEDWEVIQVTAPRGALTAQRAAVRSWRLAAALPGRGQGFRDEEPLAVWKLRARRPGGQAPQLQPVLLLDRQEQVVVARLGPGNDGGGLPDRLFLGQNFPNPFNPETAILFAIPAAGESGQTPVRLEIFDILGQRVAVLWDGPLVAGMHRVEWDGRDVRGELLGSGVYLYRLQLGDGRCQLKRMLLVR